MNTRRCKEICNFDFPFRNLADDDLKKEHLSRHEVNYLFIYDAYLLPGSCVQGGRCYYSVQLADSRLRN